MIRFARVCLIPHILQTRSFITRISPAPSPILKVNATTTLFERLAPIQTRNYTRVTRRTNIIHIRRRKMNIHKYKKRRRLLKNSTRHSMSKKKKSRPLMLKERKEIAGLLEYFKAIKMM